MKVVAKAMAVVLLTVALAAPPTAHSACGDGHDAVTSVACDCECHDSAAAATYVPAVSLALQADELTPLEICFAGRLTVVDIYRPPARI